MKQLQIALNFQANTKQAQAQMQSLSQSLNNIITNKSLNLDSSSISKASQAASELQMHLSKAVNVETGKLDLSKFNASLTSAKTNFSALSTNLLSAGTTGQQAFTKLATAIAQAQQPALTLSSTLKQMGNTLANTIRWQISSSAINMVTRAFSEAWNYAKDLNTSLTDIRIVSGKSADEMARFATYANKAAKNLSASTLDFSKASLIYYQQGLSEKEVIERANTTVKMANVTGQSMDEVSNQLTAIWNNFDDGTKSLEYYADVITALGAATASSSEEITTGLEKFAAVAETVGLSYEYATAALATVTAETRQSADVVGTAFRTLFARIQDLELGKTLEDGVSLGKYSQALETIGINILKANGDVKDMNSILEEMGNKWNNLTAAQQVSTAQTVAGVRQYTQLIALMENWDKVKENINLAEMSEGTLQQQADIYAESWEGASKRVKASMEGIWQQLLDDKVIIKATNALATFVGSISNVIEGMGGLKGIVLATLPLIAQLVINKVVPSFELLKNNLLITFNKGHEVYQKIQADFNKGINTALSGYSFSEIDTAQLTNAQKLLNMKTQLSVASSRLSQSEQLAAQMAINAYELQTQNHIENLKEQESADEEYAKAQVKTASAGAEVSLAAEKARKIAEEKVDQEIKNLKAKAEEAKKQWEIIRGNIASVNMTEEAAIEFGLTKKNLTSRTTQANTALERAKNSGDQQAIDEATAQRQRAIDNQAYHNRITVGDSNLIQGLENARKASLQGQSGFDVLNQNLLTNIQSSGGDVERLNILKETISQVYSSPELSGLKENLDTLLDELIQDAQVGGDKLKQLTADQIGDKIEPIGIKSNNGSSYEKQQLGILDSDIKADQKAENVFTEAREEVKSHKANKASLIKEEVNANTELIESKNKLAQAREKETSAEQKSAAAKEKGIKIVEGMDAAEKKLYKTLSSTTITTEKMTKGLTSGLSGAAFALSSLSSVVNTLKNPDISGWEKFVSVSMSLTMLAPSLKNAISGLYTFGSGMVQGAKYANQFGSALIGVKNVNNEQIAQMAKKITLQKMEEASVLKNISAETKEALITKLSAMSEEEKNKAKKEGLVLNGQEITGDMASAASEAIDTAATEANTAATIANYAAKFWLVTIIVAVIAALAALITMWVKNSNAQKNLENQLKESNKTYEEITENLKNAREEYDNLKSSIDAIQESQKVIDGMVTGTKEWKQAVIELNAQILDLLNKYPELAGFISSENGVLQISQEGYDTVLNAQQAHINNLAQGQVLAGMQRTTDQYRLDSYKNNMVQDEYNTIYSNLYDETLGRYKTLDERWAEVSAEFGNLWEYEEFKEEYAYQLSELLNTDQIKTEYEQQMATWTDILASQTLMNNKDYQETEFKNSAEAMFKNIFNEGKIINKKTGAEVDLSKVGSLIVGYDGTDTYKGDLNATKIENIGEILQSVGVSADRNIFLNNTAGENGQKWDNENIAKWIISQKTGVSIDDIGRNRSGSEVQYKNTGGDQLKYKTKDGEWQTLYYEDYNKMLTDYVLSSYAEQTFNNRMKDYQPIIDKLSQSEAFQSEDGQKDIEKIDQVMSTYISDGAVDLTDFTRKEIAELKNNTELYITGQTEFDEAFAKGLEEYEQNRAQAIQQANDEWSKTYEERKQQEFGTILSEAEMSTEDFDSYVAALKKTRKELKLTDAQWEEMAKANLKTANGLNKIKKVIDDNSDALNNASEDSAAYTSAINDINDAVTEWLGVDLGAEKIAELWKDGTITNAINGSTEAIKKLSLEAAKEIVIDMDIQDTSAQQVLNDLITEVDNLNLTPGMDMDISAATDKINELLRTNQITAEQAQNYWDRVGFHPEVEFTTIPSKEPSVTRSKITTGNLVNGEVVGKEQWQEVETYASITVPQYGAEGTNIAPYVGHSTTSTPASTKSNKSGGGKSSKQKSTSEDTAQRYHTLEKENEKLAASYEKVASARENAFGKSYLDNLQEEINILEAQSDNLKRHAEAAAGYYKTDKEALEAYGFTIDDNGIITNYDAIYNDMVAKNNAGTLPEEGRGSWDDFTTALDNYYNSLETKDSKEKEYIDNQLKIADSITDGVKYTRDIRNKLSDFKDQVAEWNHSFIYDDGSVDYAKASIAHAQQLGQNAWDKQNYDRTALWEMLGRYQVVDEKTGEKTRAFTSEEVQNFFKGETLDLSKLRAEDQEYVQELITSAQENISTMYEQFMSTFDEVGNMINAWNDKIDEQLEILDRLQSEADHLANVVDIVGQDFLGISDAMMDSLAETQLALSQDALSGAKLNHDAALAEQKALQDEYDKMYEKYNKDGVLTDIEKSALAKQKELVDEAADRVAETAEELNSSLEDTLTLISETFEKKVTKSLEDFQRAVTGGMTFEEQQDAYDKQKEIDDRYIEDYQKIYELSKLTRDINKSIDNTDNIKAKQALRDLEKEIAAYQADGVEMSEYDLEYLQKKYDLKMAEIALEEAQNAKSTVRLTRDAEGNYGYVYTADQDKVADAQQNYEDKLYAIQDLNKKHIEEMDSLILEAQQNMIDEISALRVSDFASEAEYQAKVQEIVDYYTGQMEYYADEQGKAIDNNNLLYTQDWQNYSNATGYKISSNAEFKEDFDSTVIGTIKSGVTNMEEYQKLLNEKLGAPGKGGLLGDLDSAYNNMATAINTAFLNAGYGEGGNATNPKGGIEGFKKQFADAVGNGTTSGTLVQKSQEAVTEIGKIKTEIDKLPDTITNLESWRTQFCTQIDQAKTAVDLLNAALTESLRLQGIEAGKQNKANAGTGDTTGDTGEIGAGGTGPGEGLERKAYSPPDTKEINGYQAKIKRKDNTFMYGYGATESAATYEILKACTKEKLNLNIGNWLAYVSRIFGWSISGRPSENDIQSIIRNKCEIDTYDTGGYTGAWGSEGRLAMLHEKELVLNKQDTENFLTATSILREISQMLDNNALVASLGMLNLKAMTVNSAADQILQQEVTIHADFPNVTDHNEIEIAIDNLINAASQHAYKI